MRVATANSYDNTIAALNKRQADLTTLQEHISTGKRVQRASDDPVAAVLSETAQNRLSRAEADKRSLEASRTSLTQAESALGEAGELIQDVRDLLRADWCLDFRTYVARALVGVGDPNVTLPLVARARPASSSRAPSPPLGANSRMP